MHSIAIEVQSNLHISGVDGESWGEVDGGLDRRRCCRMLGRIHSQLVGLSSSYPLLPSVVTMAPKSEQTCVQKQHKSWGHCPDLQLLGDGVGVCVWIACLYLCLHVGVSGLRICNKWSMRPR